MITSRSARSLKCPPRRSLKYTLPVVAQFGNRVVGQFEFTGTATASRSGLSISNSSTKYSPRQITGTCNPQPVHTTPKIRSSRACSPSRATLPPSAAIEQVSTPPAKAGFSRALVEAGTEEMYASRVSSDEECPSRACTVPSGAPAELSSESYAGGRELSVSVDPRSTSQRVYREHARSRQVAHPGLDRRQYRRRLLSDHL